MRFDSEPFRIECSQLKQCQNPRDVLIACSSAWALLCAYLQDISDFHVLEHDLSFATLARQLVDSMFSVAKVLLRKTWWHAATNGVVPCFAGSGPPKENGAEQPFLCSKFLVQLLCSEV